MRWATVFLSVLFGIVFAVVHIVALQLALYWYYSWLDSVMHVAGGVLIVWYLSLCAPAAWRTEAVVFGVLCFSVVVWELFEWYIGQTTFPADWLDTLHDIVLGLVGGSVTYWWVSR